MSGNNISPRPTHPPPKKKEREKEKKIEDEWK
jgi:hypothetical protein